MTSLKPGKPYNSQVREVIFNVYKFMSKEALESKSTIFSKDHFQSIQERTSAATGVSRKTIRKIIAEFHKASSSTSTTNQTTTCTAPKIAKRKKQRRSKSDDPSRVGITNVPLPSQPQVQQGPNPCVVNSSSNISHVLPRQDRQSPNNVLDLSPASNAGILYPIHK